MAHNENLEMPALRHEGSLRQTFANKTLVYGVSGDRTIRWYKRVGKFDLWYAVSQERAVRKAVDRAMS